MVSHYGLRTVARKERNGCLSSVEKLVWMHRFCIVDVVADRNGPRLQIRSKDQKLLLLVLCNSRPGTHPIRQVHLHLDGNRRLVRPELLCVLLWFWLAYFFSLFIFSYNTVLLNKNTISCFVCIL